MIRALVAVSLAAVLLAACGTVERRPEEHSVVDPALAKTDIVEVAPLPTLIPTQDDGVTAGMLDRQLRPVLIERKHYAVPTAQFIQSKLGGRTLSPEEARQAIGTDAVLQISLDEWDTRELQPRGRIWIGGEVVLTGFGKTLWRFTFRDRLYAVPFAVTASNQRDALESLTRDITQDLLEGLPTHRAR